MTKSPLSAVHDDDLEDVLDALGLSAAFARGEIRCKFCRDVVTWTNLHSLFPDGGDVKMACEKPICVNALLEFANSLTR